MLSIGDTPFVIAVRARLKLCLSVLPAALSILAISMASQTAQAQATTDEDLGERLKRVETMMHQNQLIEARPDMEWLKQHVDPELHPQLDFFIALSYIFEFYETENDGALSTAAEKFQAYLNAYPDHSNVQLARYNLGDIAATLGQFEEALKYYIPLFNEPGATIERTEVLKKIVLIYVATEKWEAGIPYFEASIRYAETNVDRTTAAAYMMIGKAKSGDVANIREVLAFFGNPAPIFYSPRFNTALMDVGDQLQQEEDFATASLFYQFAKDYEELKVGLEAYIRTLEERVAELADNPITRNKYLESKTELANTLADLEAIDASPNYTPLLNWKIAKVYLDIERKWEAFWRFRNMVERYPEHEFAEDILFNAYSLGNQLGQYDIAVELSERYFENDDYTSYRGTIADEMGDLYVQVEEFDKLYQTTSWYLSRESDDGAAKKLLFKHGMVRMTRYENKLLIRDFERYRERYERTKAGVVIQYFLGLAYLLEQDNQNALELFEAVVANRSDQTFTADATFRIALAYLGLDRVDEARDQAQKFIRAYPNNALRASAELVLGNIIDLQGDADTALTHYYLVDQYTEDRSLEADAELKIARIYGYQDKSDEAVARLVAFIERYRQYPETIPVAAALADIYDEAEQPRVALMVIKDTLDLFFALTEVDDLDPLLVDYIQKDRALRKSRAVTETFFDTVSSDAVLLEELISDRAKQYRYFKENDSIEALVKDSFVKDNTFRDAVLEELEELRPPPPQPDPENPDAPLPEPEPIDLTGKEIEALVQLEAEVDKLNKSIPAQSVDDWLKQEQQTAKEKGYLPLDLRIQCALAKTETPQGLPAPELVQLIEQPKMWEQIGAAAQLWIMREKARVNPALIISMLEDVGLDFINTTNEMDMHLLLAQTYERVERLEEAVERYEMLIHRFAQRDEAGQAMLTVGQLQIELGQYAEAREQLELILHRTEWRGAMHAQALLWIGRAYAAEEKYAEAHGFYERIMLGYPGFNEILATAFYEDIQTLRKMGEESSVQTVYEAFKATPGLAETKAGALIIEEFE